MSIYGVAATRLNLLVSHVKAGMGDDGVEGAKGGAAVCSPVIHIGVLPPPQRLGRATGLVVPQPVNQVGGDRREVIGEPESGRRRVRIGIEELGVLVAVDQPFG